MKFAPGFPITYRPPTAHGHLPLFCGGLITGVLPDGKYNLVLFPPNGAIEHVDGAEHGDGPGLFLIAGEEPKAKSRKAKNAETQAPAEDPASDVGAASAGGSAPPEAPPAGEDGLPPADDPAA